MLPKVLVVDDEKSVRDLLFMFLEARGFHALLASSGEEAIALAKSESPNAIVLDVKMPGIDGVETCKRLRADEHTRYIPIIMVTAFGATKTEAIDAGADDLIEKPFNLADLNVRIKSLLSVGHFRDPVQRLMTYMDELEKNRTEVI